MRSASGTRTSRRPRMPRFAGCSTRRHASCLAPRVLISRTPGGKAMQHVQGHSIEPATVAVHAGRVALTGDLTVPAQPGGIIVFAHGSGSGRLSPRNRAVAE